MTDNTAAARTACFGSAVNERGGISVIANFYNSEKYIPKLVRSLLAQTFDNWEFIAVNDCSPGNDLKILEKYAAHPAMKGRMRIIDNKVNQGISRAKATGIKAAGRKYLTFIDGDDWLEPTALECMYEAAENNNLDIVVADCYRVYLPFYKTLKKTNAKYNHVYDRQGIKDDLLKGFFGISILSSYAYWGKLFRRDLIDKMAYKPREVTISEDEFFNLYAFVAAKRVMIIDKCVYNWRWGGISSGSDKKTELSYSVMKLVGHYNDFYFEKLQIIDKFDFKQGLRPLRIELYNVLRTSFGQICRYKPGSENALLTYGLIKNALSLPAYSELLTMIDETYFHPEFIKAVSRLDMEWLYSFFHDIYKSNRTPRIMRRILSWLVK